ncbi:MAG: nucleotidyltransferase family protein [Clostridiales bacterium]|nr:nucleotidyltransferase family protein [Clostridiales bacterium]
MTDLVQLEIKILAKAFGLDKSELGDISEQDVKLIESIAISQSIVPLICFGLKLYGKSHLLSEIMINDENKAIFDYSQREAAIIEISKAFEKENISYIPLKGAFLCNLYPHPWMRTCSDIDILVKENELEKAIKVLESNTSFSFFQRAHHDVHFYNDRVHLELHFSLLTRYEKIDSILSKAWTYTINKNNSCQQLFTPEFNVFYNIAHSAKHLIRYGGIGIRPILDLLVLKNFTDYDENVVENYCEEAGLFGLYQTCLKLINVWFYGDVHNDVSKEFERLVLSGGVFGSEHIRIISNKRKDEGHSYISKRIFRSSESIKMYFPICRKYPILIPYYQIVRWLRIIRAKNKNHYYSEINKAKSVNQEEVKRYDQLLKAMGL